ncbi:ABC transporter permease [Pseudosulfitobacter pseudonitzschiae]|jgi:peptide/nickel transport system permease protein|uniref:ABC transporter permease n=1 Tax=Pseudosulfitobacter pseudonitzschiae TaxID=1402135 RepID=A0A073IYV7_9RHOB|nr:ABC transporter permease [Pseudosulfitobacter pseudonitzschiae]KEJ94641.1 ABC transporter permease [Pseudosulfitobacter pseudonitzschiae]MBM1817620.1 ABC transporter permease [Pseudosulfitobacter pseudonitzschiae]MBM1834531.1 ABC transporter permease [Pseudosulfitobacter pseudonitzschiae]MBM1839396.1 ABC transporter permease [Pseudosulfitobacter pseudonitzschiae]MBM1844246.1 ABC transporter permease [Pseudosulfitobacter pseudonitzschiae]|tara:strand:- start:8783 stop:9778 length:996 start_codon:yes stop_codon:yes gene_type:complete
MIRYISGRLAQSFIVMFVVAAVAFALFDFVGDPVRQMVTEDASQAEIERLREMMGLNDSVAVQFWRYVSGAVQGDFGVSYFHKRPVGVLLQERMPATFELAGTSVLLSILLGIPLGVYTGLHRNGRIARGLMAVSLVGISIPTFLIGIMLIYLFSVVLGWLPSFGRGETTEVFGGAWTTGFLTTSGLRALILPSITLALFQTTMVMRLVRAEMLDVMRTDYIKFARARGLRDRVVHFRHALKNTLMPVVTVIGLQLGAVIAFAIITESVFQWPGMGRLFLQAIQQVDIPVMSAYLIMIAFFFVVINLITDLTYYAIDPRLRSGALKGNAHA